jgi:hypothetical protein
MRLLFHVLYCTESVCALSLGADLRVKSTQGLDALHLALRSKDSHLLLLLLHYGAGMCLCRLLDVICSQLFISSSLHSYPHLPLSSFLAPPLLFSLLLSITSYTCPLLLSVSSPFFSPSIFAFLSPLPLFPSPLPSSIPSLLSCSLPLHSPQTLTARTTKASHHSSGSPRTEAGWLPSPVKKGPRCARRFGC